jgi:Raf kinase inhibitor-like YbhB/YbcL family protein
MRRAALALAVGAVLAACGDDGRGGAPVVTTTPPAATTEGLALRSDAFADGAAIPPAFTCEGGDDPPPLSWTGVPAGSAELVLLVEDHDAPGGTFAHWVVYALAPADTSIGAGRLPVGAVEGENGFGRIGYAGPCPPEGDDPHRYEFTLLAVPERLDLPGGATAEDVREAIGEAFLAKATLTGTFGR